MCSGLVVKETAKMYKVIEKGYSGKAFDGYHSTWNKADCFADVNSASAALIAQAGQKVTRCREEKDRAISALDLARKWARREIAELAAQPLTATGAPFVNSSTQP
jgi:hypothetical protein